MLTSGSWAKKLALNTSAVKIARKRHEKPVSSWKALSKLFIQEKRDWSVPGAPRIGWKRGELIEWLQHPSPEEWGDIGYYIAQTWNWLWALYSLVTSDVLIVNTIFKFTRRANKE